LDSNALIIFHDRPEDGVALYFYLAGIKNETKGKQDLQCYFYGTVGRRICIYCGMGLRKAQGQALKIPSGKLSF